MSLDADPVRKPIRKVRKLLQNLPKQPTPDQVHDLRTNTRRIEAMLSALSLDSRANERQALKALAQVRKKAGIVRDMDVFTSFAAGIRPDGEEDCSVQLLEHLGAKRCKSAKTLHTVATKHGKIIRNRLKRTQAELEQQLCYTDGAECDPSDARAHAAASALRLRAQLSIPKRLTRNNLHPYRLQVKELRNVLRMAENAKNTEFVDALGKVKDAIGEWHDWEELLGIAKDVLNHGARCALIRELKQVSEQKYIHALREAENMRKKYLGLPRGKTKAAIQHRSEPEWAATAAIAA
jgi:CHAD domain-containing protein